jgi:hypothetical protein
VSGSQPRLKEASDGGRPLDRPGWGSGKATPVAFASEAAQVICVDRNSVAGKELTFPRRHCSESCGVRQFLRPRVFIWCGLPTRNKGMRNALRLRRTLYEVLRNAHARAQKRILGYPKKQI